MKDGEAATLQRVPEDDRLEVLKAYPLDDAEVARRLDRLASLAAQICKAPVGLVSVVEAGRQLFLGRAGTDMEGTPREYSFCAHAMLFPEGMVVPDAREDPRFRGNPLVTGEPFIRFYAGRPLLSPEGVPLGSFCVVDSEPREGLTDEQLRGLESLSIAAMSLLDGKRIERASRERDASNQSAISELEQRFNVLADAMPQMVWSTTPDGMADYFNSVWCEFTGEPAEASYGGEWMESVHADDRPIAADAWTTAVETGQDYEVEYRLRDRHGDYRWVIARGLPMKADDGTITRWIGTCTDIHDQKESEERLALLSRELNHRIKNIFAVISGLVSLSFRKMPEAKPVATDLTDRVLALGRAHDYVRIHGGEAIVSHPHSDLKGMLGSLLAAYQDEGRTRIRVVGEDAGIDDRSATPLALFFHELATNAAKYGALSHPDGTVEITIANGTDVELAWRETGGPAVTEGSQEGFGSSLVRMSIERQLGGSLSYDWRPDGLCVTARIPGTSMSRQANT